VVLVQRVHQAEDLFGPAGGQSGGGIGGHGCSSHSAGASFSYVMTTPITIHLSGTASDHTPLKEP
jgi:hypothetical protein